MLTPSKPCKYGSSLFCSPILSTCPSSVPLSRTPQPSIWPAHPPHFRNLKKVKDIILAALPHCPVSSTSPPFLFLQSPAGASLPWTRRREGRSPWEITLSLMMGRGTLEMPKIWWRGSSESIEFAWCFPVMSASATSTISIGHCIFFYRNATVVIEARQVVMKIFEDYTQSWYWILM